MYEDMKTAEEAAEDIRKLYGRASRYIQMQGEDIFYAFRRQTGLSEDEARYLLTHAKSPKDIQAVIDFAKQIQDPAKRQELLNWIKASATQSRLSRLADLQEAIDNLVPLLYAQELKLHQDAYKKIIQDAYLHKVFDIQQYAGYGKFVTPMDNKRIDKLMRERWLGSNYSSRLWGNTNRLAKALRDELMVSFLTGRPQKEAWQAIDAEFHKGTHAARRLVRTESNYLANQGHVEAYKDSDVDKYIYVATLDMKTSEICRNLDGKVFLVKNAQPGINYPPMHPWCRSTTIAWMPAELLAKMKRTARDPITGRNYKVPANMTYNEWYKKYVINNQNTAQPQYSERNLTKTQYDNYKKRLGDDFTYSYDEFIKMKSDKDLWKAWQQSYKDSKKSDKYRDLTEVWKYNAEHNAANVTDAKRYTAPDGTQYNVDGTNVLLDYNAQEHAAGELLSKATGEKLYMCPRVTGKYGKVSTPDYLVGDSAERWDLKSLSGSSKDAVRNAITKKRGQANNFVVDVTQYKGDITSIPMQADNVFSAPNTKFVDGLLITNKGNIEKILKRK